MTAIIKIFLDLCFQSRYDAVKFRRICFSGQKGFIAKNLKFAEGGWRPVVTIPSLGCHSLSLLPPRDRESEKIR